MPEREVLPDNRSVRHILRNALRPSFFPVMAGKVVDRVRHPVGAETAAATQWAEERASELGAWASALDPQLWSEAQNFATHARDEGERRLQELSSQDVQLGGGAAIELLYFLTRLRQPTAVLETGVAAGWSSWAFLAALEANGTGHLYSSDFPYFRFDSPERWIGYVVPTELKKRWSLHLRGDRQNLPLIFKECREFDLVHYDSDKSRAGRQRTFSALQGRLKPGSALVMDDIQDDLYFRDKFGDRATVFHYDGKYVGLVHADSGC